MSDDQNPHTPPGAVVLTRATALLLFVLGVYPLANVLTAGQSVPWYRHALMVWVFVGGSLILAMTLLARLLEARRESVWSVVSGAWMRIPWPVFVGACALAAFALSAWLSVYCFGRVPHNADEAAQLFHAKILLGGRLTLPVDPNPEFFQMDDVISGARWYSQFPIGGPLFLALGDLVGAAWLLNPALIALSLLFTAAFARRAFGEALGRVVAALSALCPFALFMGASFMNHVPTMLLVSIATWQLARWTVATTARQAGVAAAVIGLAIGVAFTVRPLDALAAAAVIGGFQLSLLRRSAPRMRSLGPQIACGLVPVGLMLYVNAVTNGGATTLGYEVLYGTAHQMGFHVDPYGTLHSPMRALLYASTYLLQLNVLLFEWPLPAVAIIIAGLVALRRPGRWDLFLVAMLLAQLIAYALYWHEGSFRGPRFLFTALPAIVILVARAPFIITARTGGTARALAAWLLPACVLFAWLAYGTGDSMPGRIRQYRSAAQVTRVRPDSLARANGLHHALVLINEGQEARNLHLLWSMGINRGDASRLMVSASSCAVRQAIDSVGTADARGRRDRLIRSALAFNTRGATPAACIADARRDEEGTAIYVPFFAANDIDDLGRISGDVIYALDLGERNALLRQRFGDRKWYRFGARRNGNVETLSLTPLTPP